MHISHYSAESVENSKDTFQVKVLGGKFTWISLFEYNDSSIYVEWIKKLNILPLYIVLETCSHTELEQHLKEYKIEVKDVVKTTEAFLYKIMLDSNSKIDFFFPLLFEYYCSIDDGMIHVFSFKDVPLNLSYVDTSIEFYDENSIMHDRILVDLNELGAVFQISAAGSGIEILAQQENKFSNTDYLIKSFTNITDQIEFDDENNE